MIITFKVSLALISCLLMATFAFADSKLQEEKELEVVDFKSIKKVLQKDGLSEAAEQKRKEVEELKKEQAIVETGRHHYPNENDFWGFMSEYWLVKNAQLLSWDFEKPDYGIEGAFKQTLEKLGFYHQKFKILLLNTPSVVRGGLPSDDGEVILLLSVPFIRSMDMSKLEISLYLLEDFFRLQLGYFKNNVTTEKLKKLAGTNFQGTKPDLSLIEEISKNYSQQLLQKGFTFQQQFEVTKKMDSFLKGNPELWNGYFRLLGKIERFMKINVQYKDYVRLYPSPEMQMKWLGPEDKVL